MKNKREMKKIKHIWRYITSPTYRFWVDFCTQEELINKQMKAIEDNLMLKTYPMFKVENGKITPLKDEK